MNAFSASASANSPMSRSPAVVSPRVIREHTPENMMFPRLLELSPEEQAKRDERWRERRRRNALFFVLTSAGGLAVLAALWLMVPRLVLVLWPPDTNVPLGNYSSWGAVTVKECAGVPRRVFAKHGTIGDAAVALTLCTCIALPMHCGLGGGLMALYYNNATGVSWFVDGREESPSVASQSFYEASNTTERGILSIAVPGQMRGLMKLHELTGNNLPWKTLFQEAIDLARDGFKMSKRVLEDLEIYRNVIENNRAFRRLFDIDQLRAGGQFKQSDMAETLVKLASASRKDYFYQKEFAEEWHQELAESGSLIKLTDILNYEARLLPTLSTKLEDDLVLVTAPPPTTGAITAAICGIVRKWYASHPAVDDASFYHILAEASKFGFGRRSLFGDYNFTDPKRVAEMVDPEYAKAQVERIQADGVLGSYADYYVEPEKAPGESHYAIKSPSGGAVPIIIWAPNGDVVALETSLNSILGSQVISDTKGIIYNNLMNDFDLPHMTNVWGFPGSLSSNALTASRRPVSSLAPAFLFRKGVLVAATVGVGGGFAVTGTAQVLLRNVLFKRTPKEAIEWYRAHHQLMPNTLFLEAGMDYGLQSFLRYQSHDVHLLQRWTGIVVAMTWDAGRIYATYDFRDTALANTVVGE